MREEQLENHSALEREHRLWRASRQYLSGDIDVESFEKEKMLLLQNIEQYDTFIMRRNKKIFLYVLVAMCMTLTILGFIMYLDNKNQLFLILSAVPVYLINIVVRDLLSERNENREPPE